MVTTSRLLAASVALILVASAASTGCNPKNTNDTPPPVPAEPAPAPEPAPEPMKVASPQELYAECEQRVEGTQKDGECTKDEDCATAGCGNEVCVTAAEKANVMTTCEDKLCFKVLDACGCHDGECTWTLKTEVPADAVPTTPGGALPSTLPPTNPPAGGEPGAEGEDAKGEKAGKAEH